MCKTLIKNGIMLSITSWENDADYYNTKTLYGLSEAEAKFWLALAKLCGSEKYANIYMRYDSEFDKYALADDFLKLMSEHHSGFAVATVGWNVDSVAVILNEEDPAYEEKVGDIVSLASELAYEVLGSSPDYSFRVFESYKAHFIKDTEGITL